MLYDRILVAVDPGPSETDFHLPRIQQLGQMTGATIYLLHIARGHIVPGDISAGAGLGVLTAEDDVEDHERAMVQEAVDKLAAAGIPTHGELVSATEHDVPDIILERARDLRVDLIVLGPQHQRTHVVERLIRHRPPCSVLLTRPPQAG